jgi:plasmid replication initiation protein
MKSKSLTVIKANKLIEASYKLTVAEQKIVLMLATQINFNDEDFKSYTFAIKDLMQILGFTSPSQYAEIRKTTLKLMTGIEIRGEEGKIRQMPWLIGTEYDDTDENATVNLQFHPWLRPFFLKLKANFTQYRYENIIQLKSKYSIRIYELLRQYKKIGERNLSVEFLRDRFLLGENEYPVYKDFKRNVILIAQRELAEKTDICFEFEEFKTGRKITDIKFIIKDNMKQVKMKEFDMFSENLEDIFEPLREQLDPKEELLDMTVSRLRNKIGFKTRTINSIIKKHSLEYVNANIDIVLVAYESGKVNDLQAFTRSALRDDYRKNLSELDLQQAKEKEEISKQIGEAQAQAIAALEENNDESTDNLSAEWAMRLQKIKKLDKDRLTQ